MVQVSDHDDYEAEAELAMDEVRACHRQLIGLAKISMAMPKLDRPVAGFPVNTDEATAELHERGVLHDSGSWTDLKSTRWIAYVLKLANGAVERQRPDEEPWVKSWLAVKVWDQRVFEETVFMDDALTALNGGTSRVPLVQHFEPRMRGNAE